MIDELFDRLCVYVVRSGTIALLRPETEEKNPMEVVAPGSIVGLRAAINGDLQLDGKGIDGFRTGIYQLRPCSRGACEQACALAGSHAHHESGSRQDAIVHRGALHPHRGIANAGPLMRRAEETPWAQPRRGRSAGYRRLLQDCLSNTRCITR